MVPAGIEPCNRLACAHDPPTGSAGSSECPVSVQDGPLAVAPEPSRLSPRARRNILVGLLATVAFGLAVLAAAWSRACAGNTCPSIEELGGYDPDQASKVYAADGRLITDLGLERRTVIPLGEMSPFVKTAFLATEDKRFYSHHGIDWFRVFGAIKTNVFAAPVRRRLLDHHDAAGPEHLGRGHQRHRQVAPPQAARSAGGARRSSRSIPRTRSSRST